MPENILSRAFYSLGEKINKFTGAEQETSEGVVSQLLPELELSLSDEELIKLKKKWESNSRDYTLKILEKQKENEQYYLGKSFGSDLQSGKALADNEIFMAVETFIPEVTRANPEPVVTINGESTEFAELNKDIVIQRADELTVRLKMKKNVRFWSLYYLGPVKFGWDETEDDFTVEVVRPQKLILDKNATINEGVYNGSFIGEYRRKPAYKLAEEFPAKKDFITKLVKGSMGTELQYIEWWTNEFVFWTLEDEVLDKKKNPHFNYSGETVVVTDVMGNEAEQETLPVNHFKVPQIPYAFLSVFSLDKQPHDETSLIEQNLPNQDRINKMLRQIDKNIDNMNNGIVISGDAMTKEDAATAAKAIRNGGTVWIPKGNASSAVSRIPSPSLPADVYNTLTTAKQDLSAIFGTTGFTPQGIKSEETVRGKILIKGQDQGRNSGISEHIEQLYDQIYNWFVQMTYVYYEQEHLERILGEEDAKRYLEMKATNTSRMLVSVKEGSLIPKDPLTKRNEAVDRFASGSIDPLSYMEALDVPDPLEATKRLLMYQADPFAYAAELGIQLPAQPVPAGGGVGAPVAEEAPVAPEQAAANDPMAQDVLSAVPIE